jgi:prepilin-type N-terminal cleavage/methylation domain-containing protein
MKKLSITYNLGFTLIELLIVISIIGVLSSIVIVSTNDARAKSRDAYRLSQIREIKTALELYYSAHEQYPANIFPLTYDENIPHNWANMVNALDGENFIHATFSEADIDNNFRFSLINKAYAQLEAIYYNCSLQDPLYKGGSDYQYSYGYVASADRKSYRIRIYLENESNQMFQSSMSGMFLDSQTAGNTACDKDFHYYCTGIGANFAPPPL